MLGIISETTPSDVYALTPIFTLFMASYLGIFWFCVLLILCLICKWNSISTSWLLINLERIQGKVLGAVLILLVPRKHQLVYSTGIQCSTLAPNTLSSIWKVPDWTCMDDTPGFCFLCLQQETRAPLHPRALQDRVFPGSNEFCTVPSQQA